MDSSDEESFLNEASTPGRVFHADGTQSVVYRQLDPRSSEIEPKWMAVKIVSFQANASIKPHDVLKEIKILEEIKHPNITELVDSWVDDHRQQYELEMPLYPISLDDLLWSPYFVPRSYVPSEPTLPPPRSPFGSPLTSGLEGERFLILTKSFTYQLVHALSFMHSQDPPIAHRDIKPGNVLINEGGCVKLIDFGVAWRESLVPDRTEGEVSPYDIPEETKESMSCAVGSGQYRAIELLFSPETYDARATDLWSLGVVLCMFFTSIRYVRDVVGDDESDDGVQNDDQEVVDAEFRFDGEPTSAQRMRWSRRNVFSTSRGEIGLILSVLKLLGLPTEESWPEFRFLPGARMVSFTNILPPANNALASLLTNLPSPDTLPPNSQVTSSFDMPSILSLISSLLVLNPSRRVSARELLRNPWCRDTPVMLPEAYPRLHGDDVIGQTTFFRWDMGGTLGDILRPAMDSVKAEWGIPKT